MEENHNNSYAAWLIHWIKLAALFAVAAFLAFAWFADWLDNYLAPQYVWLPPTGAVALALMALARLTASPSAESGCCDEHCSTGPQSPGKAVFTALISLIILVVPIALALAVQPTEFSSEGMRKRRLATPPRDVRLERAVDWVLGIADADDTAEVTADSLPKEPTLLQLVEAAAVADPNELSGKFITVVGRCDLPDGEASRRFQVYRLLVTCCIADSSAISVEVARNDDVRLEPGGWVRIGGILKFDDPIDPSAPVVHAATISKVSEPSEPYL